MLLCDSDVNTLRELFARSKVVTGGVPFSGTPFYTLFRWCSPVHVILVEKA
jgi:hypothetical protein